jgi:NADH-quinone oxidoreductase subunit K
MLGPGVAWYAAIGSAIFAIGAAGVMLRRNPLIMLLSLELMLNGANLVLIAFARLHGSLAGQVFALSVMAVAAAEVVVGLGLAVAMVRKKIEIDVDLLSRMRR